MFINLKELLLKNLRLFLDLIFSKRATKDLIKLHIVLISLKDLFKFNTKN